MTAAHANVGPWTVADLLALPEDGNRHELVDGALVMNPPPSPSHQLMAGRLFTLLTHAARAAGTPVHVIEAVGVQIDEDVLLVPDLVVISRSAHLDGPVLDRHDVDLAVEIVSPGSTTRDRTEKPFLYAEAGIPHFWRIETTDFRGRENPLPVIFAHELVSVVDYGPPRATGAGEIFTSDEPIPVRFDPAELAR